MNSGVGGLISNNLPPNSPNMKRKIKYIDMQESINLQKLLKFQERASSTSNYQFGSQTARDMQRTMLNSREQEDSILINKILSKAQLIQKPKEDE